MNETIQSGQSPYSDSPKLVPAEKPFPWGCMLVGCLSVMLVMMLGMGGLIYGGYRFYAAQVAAYTSPDAVELPKVDYAQAEIDELNKKLADFKVAVDRNEATDALVLSADDINALINANEDLKGKVFVKIEDGEVSADASIPLDKIPGAQGRFFNGSISLKATIDNGKLLVTLDDAEVNGKPVPEEFVREFRKQNLAEEAYKDPKQAEYLRKFEKLTIEDDKIILQPTPPK